MSKKMLKRSLALGALMAFVITGSAMAADYNDGPMKLDNRVESQYDNVTITATSLGTANIGLHLHGTSGIYVNDTLRINCDYIAINICESNSDSMTVEARNIYLASNAGGNAISMMNDGTGINYPNLNIQGFDKLQITAFKNGIATANGANSSIKITGNDGSEVDINAGENAVYTHSSNSGNSVTIKADEIKLKSTYASNETEKYGYAINTSSVNGSVSVDAKTKVTLEGTQGAILVNNKGTVKIIAPTADFKGQVHAKDGTVDLSGIDKLIIKGYTDKPAIVVDKNNGKLNVNSAGNLEITGAQAGGVYQVASGVAGKLWEDSNLAYDRTALYAVGNNENDDVYTVTYSAITEENIEEAKEGIVTATGGSELAVPELVSAAVGNSDIATTAPAAQELLSEVTSNADLTPSQKAAVINSAAQLAEAGGNAGTAVSVANNVAGVTTGRMSFGGRGHGGHKGGHGVGMFEEGSGAAVWAQYMHGKDDATDMPMDGGATSYESEYDGIVVGVDFKKVGKFQSGIAFNYGEGDSTGFTSAAKTKSDYDFWGVGYYGNIRNEDTNFIFDVNYAKSDSDVIQSNPVGDIEASPETTTWSAGVKVEKLYQNNNVQIVPYTGLRYMSIDTEEYQSNMGGDTLFNYAPERQDIWLLPLGVSIRQEVVNDNGWVVTPKVDLSYIWAFGDTDSNMSVSIPGIAASNDTLGFTVMDDGSFLGLVGVEAKLDDWTFGVSYSYQKGDYAESKKWFVDAKYSF